MDDKHLTEFDKHDKNILLNTIRFPRDLHYLTDRLPKPNYAQARTKVLEKQKFLQTLAGYQSRDRHDDSFEKLMKRGSESVNPGDRRKPNFADPPGKR